MSSIPVDLDRAKMQYLLRQLSLERLDRESAQELKPLLQREAQYTTDPRYRNVLFRLIEILDQYIRGEVNLMPELSISNVSNLG